jgi:hypothetical protein
MANFNGLCSEEGDMLPACLDECWILKEIKNQVGFRNFSFRNLC